MSLKVKFFLLSLSTFIALIIISNVSKFGIKVEPIFAFTVVFFALGAGYIFIWKILNPVEKYKIAIDRALKGQYVDVGYKGGDEVGKLGERLSELIKKLKRRDLENFIISRIDHILLSNIKVEDASEEILKIFKEGLGYYRFSIYLVDKENQKFCLIRSIGFENKNLAPEISFGQAGLMDYAYMFRSSVYSPDVQKDQRYIRRDPKVKSEFQVLLSLEDNVLGVLSVESDKIDGIKPEDREFLSRIAPQITRAFINSELYNQAIKRLKQLNVLNKVSQAIGFKTDLEEILRSVLKLMMENYNTDKIAIFLKDLGGKGKTLTSTISIGVSERLIKAAEDYTPWRSEEKVFPVVINEVESDKSLFQFKDVLVEEGVKSLFFFPIVYREKFIGRLDVYFSSQRSLEKEEIDLGVSICNEVASAIENARLFELLKSSEKFIRTVLENTPIGILRIDSEGRLLYLNSEMKRILGFGEEDVSKIMGEKLITVLNVKDKDVEFFWDGMLKGKTIKRQPVSFRSFQGKEISIIVDVQPIFTKSGTIEGYIVIVRDVTEEENLQYEKMKLSHAIEGLSEAVVITDTNGNIEYVNPAFEKMTGYKIQEVIGRNPRFLKSGKHDRKFYENMWKTILSGKIWTGELINKKKNGDFYYEHMTITPLFDANGNITNFIAIKRDMTEQKLFEAQMLQFQKLESIGLISSGITHDFNNVLSSIQAGIKILKRRLAGEDQEIMKVLDILKKSADRGADITRRLLNFVRRGSGRALVVDVKDLIQEVNALVVHSFPENIEKKNIKAHEYTNHC
ncbi:MAG: PAS domain S-box protein [Candidatus Kryptonium sp.]